MANTLGIVVLAAGKGTRLKSEQAKVLHRAGGLPLLAHVLRAVRPLRAGVWVVVGYQANEVVALTESHGTRSVLQRPQLGTGHAVLVALKGLPRVVKQVVVLPGDAPLVTTDSLRALLREHRSSVAAATILTADLENPHGYGRILRSLSGRVDAIVEQSALHPDQQHITEVNSGMYCFERAALQATLSRLGRSNVHKEYYLTDVIALLRAGGQEVAAYRTPNSEEMLGANTRAELAWVDSVLRRRKAEAVMASGVTLYQPGSQMIDPDVAIGTDTVVEPRVELRGATRIGQRCSIGTGSVLVNAVLADDVIVKPHTLVFNSKVARGVSLGPFAHLRDGADIRADARIGNYVEVKKSVVGEGAKAQHLTYLGDATVGSKTNVGAGTVTCNYDGVNKNPTRIGEGVFIGSGTMLVAPVRVGSGAYVAAGSTITENVPADGLGIARGKQVNKPGWAKERRKVLAAIARGKSGKGKKKVKKKTPKKAGKRKPSRRR